MEREAGSAFILGKRGQVHSRKTEVTGSEEREIAAKEAIIIDDMFLL